MWTATAWGLLKAWEFDSHKVEWISLRPQCLGANGYSEPITFPNIPISVIFSQLENELNVLSGLVP